MVGGKLLACKTVPDAHAKSLFVFLIPPTDNQHEHWSNSSFKEAEEESLCKKPLEICAARGSHQNSSPDNNHPSTDALNGEALGNVYCRVGPCNPAKIEHRRSHRIPVSNRQRQVVSKSKYCLHPMPFGNCQDMLLSCSRITYRLG